MKICYFGSYDKEYNRSNVIINGLRKNDIDVLEYNDRHSFLKRAPSLFLKGLKSDFDVLLVGYPGHIDVFVAKLITFLKRKPLVFDVFISGYDAEVLDNKLIKDTSLKAKWLHFLDKCSCTIADMVLLDTQEHINFFVKEFKLKREKFRELPIGADEDVFYPRKHRLKKGFTILHYGRTSGLHGIPYILEAMRLLEEHKDIKLVLIGDFKSLESYRKIERKNVIFKELVPLEELPEWIASSDVCLGIFGGTGKSDRVVPNKIYEVMAMGKPIITGDSSSIRRILKNNESAILCEMKNPKAIADAILLLKNNLTLRGKIAKNAYHIFQEGFTRKRIGKILKNYLDEALHLKGEL